MKRIPVSPLGTVTSSSSSKIGNFRTTTRRFASRHAPEGEGNGWTGPMSVRSRRWRALRGRRRGYGCGVVIAVILDTTFLINLRRPESAAAALARELDGLRLCSQLPNRRL